MRKHEFLVDCYESSLRVWPVVPRAAYEVTQGIQPRTVIYDNVAHFHGSVTFSKHNACREMFTLRYATRGDGFILPPCLSPNRNEASRADLGRYLDRGMEFHYCFTPQPGQTYSMNLEVLKGFDAGNRTNHMHLHWNTRYQKIIYRLDLQRYLEQGYPLTQGPSLYFHADDPHDHDVCKLRGYGAVIKPEASSGAGLYSWRIIGPVSGGVVDVVWDLAGPETRFTADDPVWHKREQLVHSKLRQCRIFAFVMALLNGPEPLSWRQIEDRSAANMPGYRLHSDIVHESAISRSVRTVRKLLADPAFLGRDQKLFDGWPGQILKPNDHARAALNVLLPILQRLNQEP
ncbi:MAG TPA: hypothetical protein VKU02_06890 [Gemmataceae bacterium]|nr:hypothetical protein [Gemmataceae bacterium]